MEKITIKVTKGHFDKALAITEKNSPTLSATKVCLLAQAIKGAFPKQKINVTYDHAYVGNTTYVLSAAGRRLLKRFDENGAWHGAELRSKREVTALARLRANLPATFIITEA